MYVHVCSIDCRHNSPFLEQERSSTDALTKMTVADVEKQLQDDFAEKLKRQTKLMKDKLAAALAETEEEKSARYELIFPFMWKRGQIHGQ